MMLTRRHALKRFGGLCLTHGSPGADPTAHEPDMNGESYFRVHGPNLLIEHAPQDNQGGYKLHVHTVMRDLGNDYAKQLL